MLSDDQQKRLKELNVAFLEENAKLNLSAFRTQELSWVGNVLDSVALLEAGVLPYGETSTSQYTPPHFPHPPAPSPDGGRGALHWEPKRNKPLSRTLLWNARELRKNPTKAEEILWEHIRDNQLGVHFRRQHPIGGLVIDFYCHEHRMGIEIDGGIHQEKEQREYDAERTMKLLDGYDIRLIRFRNEEVLNNIQNVLQTIYKEISKSPPPPPGEGLGVGEVERNEEGLGMEVKGKTEEGLGVGEVERNEEGLGVEVKNREKKKSMEILDLGTGGGFPLLPLALCFPGCSFVGMDATQKKVAAVERIAQTMELENVRLVAGRAEELGHDPDHRERYDLVLARAVAAINTLIELTAPFAKVGGHIVLWKSMNISTELEESLLARAELSCHLEQKFEYELPENFGKRQLLIFTKAHKTADKYPRSTGTPKKKPLL